MNYGKKANCTNNAATTVSLPLAHKNTKYKVMANANVRNHWANITACTTSQITIYIADYGNAVNSGFHYWTVGS